MGNDKSYAMCPNCGTELLKARMADGVEICCKKCKKKYEVGLSKDALVLHEIRTEYTATA